MCPNPFCFDAAGPATIIRGAGVPAQLGGGGGSPRPPPHPNHFKRFKRLEHFGSILAKSQRYLALKTEGYTVAIRGGNEVNTKRKRQYMQYVQFPMLNCEGNTLPKCEGDPMQMTAYPGGYPVQSVKGTIFTL